MYHIVCCLLVPWFILILCYMTTRYLYLLFDEDNFIHNRGNVATVVDGPGGQDGGNKCVVDAGGYIFNTEAHVIDPAAAACCSSHTEEEVSDSTVDSDLEGRESRKVRYVLFPGELVY